MTTENTGAAQPQATPAASETQTPAATTEAQAAPATEAGKEAKTEGTLLTPKPAAQEEIKYDLKLSEGSLLDKSRVDAILAEAKESKLTNEQAQNLLKREEKVVSDFQTQQQQKFETAKSNWLKELETDKEVGGDKLKENAEVAHLFLKKHADQKMLDFLDATGYGNNPTVFKFVLKLAKMAQSDSMVNGGRGVNSGDKKSIADRMYDKT